MGDISLVYLFRLAWRRLWALILAAVIFAVGAICYCRFWATPQYTSRASIFVTNGNILSSDQGNNTVDDTTNTSDYSVSLLLARNVVQILTSNTFNSQVANYLNEDPKYASLSNRGKYKDSTLAGMVTVAPKEDNTLSINISVKSSNPADAILIANAVAEYSESYISEFFLQANTKVLNVANSASKVYPRTAVTTFLAAVMGAALAFLAVLTVDLLNQTIRGEEEFALKYDVPLLGSVPDFENVDLIGTYKYKSKDGGA